MSEKWVTYNEHDELIRAMAEIERLTARVTKLEKEIEYASLTRRDQDEEIERLDSALKTSRRTRDEGIYWYGKRIAELEAARVIVSRWYCENCGCQECLAAEAALEVDDE